MTNLLADKLPQSIKRLNRKLNQKGFEIKKRRAFVIEPMSKTMPVNAQTMGQPVW